MLTEDQTMDGLEKTVKVMSKRVAVFGGRQFVLGQKVSARQVNAKIAFLDKRGMVLRAETDWEAGRFPTGFLLSIRGRMFRCVAVNGVYLTLHTRAV